VGSFDGNVYALDAASGEVSWRHDTGAPVSSSAAVAGDRVLIGSRSYDLFAFDAATGRSLATVPSSTTVTHGVAISPDSRYAFVSVEGKGSEPGKVDVYDLRTFTVAGSAEVGQQAGGIVFWRMEPAG